MGRQRKGPKIHWTEEMNNLVLQCREKALKLSNSEDPPRYENGRKIGYMRLMKDFWEELGMEHLELTSQNLRDQAAALDKSIGSVAGNIASRVGRRRRSAGGREGNEAEEEGNLERDNSQYANEQKIGANFHTENSENQTMRHEEFINTLTQGWKKDPKDKLVKQRLYNGEKWKKNYLDEMGEIRKYISIASAEVNRVKENRKLTKRGRKNRALLQEECKSLSVTQLITYIEKQKFRLRKLKAAFGRKKRQEEAKSLNDQFRTDPGRVYARINQIVAEDPDNAQPKYKAASPTVEQSGGGKNMFEDIGEPEGFWRTLWEEQGSGDENAGWLKEIEEGIRQRVPPASQEEWDLETAVIAKVISKKRNWSAPGPDRVVNFWWKRAYAVHEDVKINFKGISESLQAYPEWFAQGKSSLIPKPGEFSSEHQRPITCLNTGYKWFTSCVLGSMDYHLDYYDLMEMQQRGAKAKCSGTTDNLMIDRMVTLDCHRHKRNLSVAWIDVPKAFDSVDHGWLKKILRINRFPTWICRVVDNLSDSWNTRIAVKTMKGHEVSPPINFNRGLPQGDALCPRLFTLCLNPVAWKLSSTEGYRLSKPVVGNNITNLLYVDDLRIFASSQAKLNRVLKMTEEAMGDIGLLWNPKKCNVLHVRRGVIDKTSQGFKAGQTAIDCLKDKQYCFLGAPEQLLQDQKLALETAARTYLQRLSVIWSSPLSDMNRVTASNQLALPVLTYLMWPQHWNLTDLRNIDREARKVISENGGKHPLGSTALLYLPRHQGGRGLRSVETEYKHTKIKSAIKLYQNKDPTMSLEASTFAEEMGISLELSHPNPRCLKEDGTEVPNINNHLKQSSRQQLEDKIRGEKWQGKYLTNRWNDDDLNVQGCFGWLKVGVA
ncbi:uncharacterized protein [Montipora capricornis]|uniref:uncharacterized protein n=1 Tax=Montipora capricornis TaxID=246305 RepID=UPI0035F10A4E